MIEILAIIFPIFIVFGFGFFLKKKFNSDISTLSNVSFYCLLPALVFKNFYTSTIGNEIGWVVLFSVILFGGIVLLTHLFAVIFRFDKEDRTALLLGSSFPNAGNYGSSLIFLAYGQQGFEWAILFYVIQQMLLNSFGIFFAAQGQTNFSVTIKKVAKIPALYAGAAGILLQRFQIDLPAVIYTPIEMLSQAMVPLLMLILGMQLATIKGFGFAKGTTIGVSMRLIISPLLAYLLLLVLPFNELASKTLLIQSAMPAAVLPNILAIQYNRNPEMVSGITLFSTLLSVITISFLLYVL